MTLRIRRVLLGLIATWAGGCFSMALVACDGDDSVGPRRDAGADVTLSDAADGGAGACATYCARVGAACSGANAQYASPAACEKICSGFAPPLDLSTNTSVFCRYAHALEAGTQPDVECERAGVFAAGTCGDRCDVFCDLAMKFCDGKAGAQAYPTWGDCKVICEAYKKTADKKVTPSGPTTGDTRECRAYHLLAAVENPSVHCPHVAQVSSTCVDPPSDGGTDGALDGGDGGPNDSGGGG